MRSRRGGARAEPRPTRPPAEPFLLLAEAHTHSSAVLHESNVLGVVAEALAADVHVVLADDTVGVPAHAAGVAASPVLLGVAVPDVGVTHAAERNLGPPAPAPVTDSLVRLVDHDHLIPTVARVLA